MNQIETQKITVEQVENAISEIRHQFTSIDTDKVLNVKMWDKVAGKERIYVNDEFGTQFYIDLNAKKLVNVNVTGKYNTRMAILETLPNKLGLN
jgi:hypothetical protein